MSGIPVHWKLRLASDRGHVLVDDADLHHVLGRALYLHSAGYASVEVDGKMMLIHRLVMDAPRGKVVDHLNHKRLDDRRSNLRVCTQRENMTNTVGRNKLRGVARNNNGTVFAAFRGRYLGSFQNEMQAAMRYDEELYAQCGSAAHFNFPCVFVGGEP